MRKISLQPFLDNLTSNKILYNKKNSNNNSRRKNSNVQENKDKKNDKEKDKESQYSNSNISHFNKNPSLKFSFYSDRRDIFIYPNRSPVLSYLNPKEDLSANGVSVFSKGPSARRDIFRTSIVPAGVDYRPKFESISKKPVIDIKFSGKFGRLDNGKKKKNLKKIFCAYDVPSKFQSVNIILDEKKYNINDIPILIDWYQGYNEKGNKLSKISKFIIIFIIL